MTSDEKFWLGMWSIVVGAIVSISFIILLSDIEDNRLQEKMMKEGYNEKVVEVCTQYSTKIILEKGEK